MRIGIYGSAKGKFSDELERKARDVGIWLAIMNNENDIQLVTGACPGLPDLVARAAKGKDSTIYIEGYSPYKNKFEHIKAGFPADLTYTNIMYTGRGRKARNIESIHSCDAALFIQGRWGTINEFTIAYDDFLENQAIGILEGTGGFADEARRLVNLLGKETKAQLLYNTKPELFVKRVITGVRKYER